jgi:hypothetical protein
MEVQPTLTRASHLAAVAHRELTELGYDLPAWEALTAAGQTAALIDAAAQLKTAYVGLRTIAAAVKLHQAAAPAPPPAVRLTV